MTTDAEKLDAAMMKAAGDPDLGALMVELGRLQAIEMGAGSMILAVAHGEFERANDIFVALGGAIFGCQDPDCDCRKPGGPNYDGPDAA